MDIRETRSVSSSPVFAYGEAPSFSHRHRVFSISLVCIAVLAIGVLLLARATLQLPRRIVFFAAVRGNTQLPEGMPHAWKNAIEHTRAPILLGMFLEENALIPFALSLSRTQAPGLSETRIGLFFLLSEKKIRATEPHALTKILLLFMRPLVSPAYLVFEAQAIHPRFTQNIHGPMDARGVWRTRTRLARHATTRAEFGDVMIDFETFPEAWPLVQATMQNMPAFSRIESRPAALSFVTASHTIEQFDLQLRTPLASSTLQRVAAEFGMTDRAPYRLQDGVVVEELRLAEQANTSSTMSLSFASGSRVEISPMRLTLKLQEKLPVRPEPCAPGTLVFRLRGQALEHIREVLQLPVATQTRTVDVTMHNQRLFVCFHKIL